MSEYNTGNPVPSIDPRDLDDNATVLDNLLTGDGLSYPDRKGLLRRSWQQMELDAQALVSPNVAAFAGLSGASDRVPYFTGAGALALAVLTTAARTFMAADSAPAQRIVLGLTDSATMTPAVANGVATLGADGKLAANQIPALAISETFTVANQAAMLALTAQRGDVAIRTDLNGAFYMLTADAPATLANWVPIQQNLGVALTALAAVTPAADKLAYFTGAGAAALADFTAVARTLLAATTQAAQRTALGVIAQTDKPAFTTYTPTVGSTTGAYGAASGTGKYLVEFGMCDFSVTLTITTKGTGAFPTFTLPVAGLAGLSTLVATALEITTNGKSGVARYTDTTHAQVRGADGLDLILSDGNQVIVTGRYPVA